MQGIIDYFVGLGTFIQQAKSSISEDGLGAYIETFASKVFDFYTSMFLNFLDKSKPMFNQLGRKAISTFHFDFNDNFIVTCVGLIFGFFLFKFVLGKVIDLIGRWLDPA